MTNGLLKKKFFFKKGSKHIRQNLYLGQFADQLLELFLQQKGYPQAMLGVLAFKNELSQIVSN